MDFAATWGWPQWTLAVWMALSVMYQAGQHGKPRLQTGGPDKGKPEEYNGFVVLVKYGLMIGILIAGGFFR